MNAGASTSCKLVVGLLALAALGGAAAAQSGGGGCHRIQDQTAADADVPFGEWFLCDSNTTIKGRWDGDAPWKVWLSAEGRFEEAARKPDHRVEREASKGVARFPTASLGEVVTRDDGDETVTVAVATVNPLTTYAGSFTLEEEVVPQATTSLGGLPPLWIIAIGFALGLAVVVLVVWLVRTRDSSPTVKSRDRPSSTSGGSTREPASGVSKVGQESQDTRVYAEWAETEPTDLTGDDLTLLYGGTDLQATWKANRWVVPKSSEPDSGLSPGKLAVDHPEVEVSSAREKSSGNLEVELAPRAHPVEVSTVSARDGTPLPNLPFTITRTASPLLGAGASARQSTDSSGTFTADLWAGTYRVELAGAGYLDADPVTVEVGGGRSRTRARLEASVSGLETPRTSAYNVEVPGTIDHDPALAQLLRAAIERYVDAWEQVLNDPAQNLRLHRHGPEDDPQAYGRGMHEALQEMSEKLSEVFAEKKIQMHLSSAEPQTWSGSLDWTPDLDPVLGDGGAVNLHFEVGNRMSNLDTRVTQASSGQFTRPALRLLQLAEDLNEREDSLAHVTAADLVLDVVEVFLEDPSLNREWAE